MAINKYEEIAQAAIKLFEQKGYHATSVQDIADEVGLQKGSLYHYISSKEELLLKIAQQSISNFNRRLEKIIDSQMSAKARLIAAVQNHIMYVAGNMEMTTVLLREAFSLEPEHHQVIKAETDKYLSLWTTIIEQGAQSGKFKSGNSRLTALAILGSCNWLHRWYQQEGKLTPEEIGNYFAHIFLEGIQK